jgi:hypothetical protein
MLEAKYEEITPARAEELLVLNTCNYRTTMSKSNIDNLVLELMENQWQPTTQGIGFDTNNNLVDGQHRLTAIVKSGKTVKDQLVCYGLPVDSRLKIDIGKKRSLADLTGISGKVISTIRVPFRLAHGNSNATMSLTYMQKYIHGDLGRLAQLLHETCPSYFGIMSSGMRAGLIMAIMAGTISEHEGLKVFVKMSQLRQNSKKQYMNTSIKSRRDIETSLPLLLVSLIEKLRQGLIPVYDGTAYKDVDYDVRERASKLMLLFMQAFDSGINHQEEFNTPCHNTVIRVLGL